MLYLLIFIPKTSNQSHISQKEKTLCLLSVCVGRRAPARVGRGLGRAEAVPMLCPVMGWDGTRQEWDRRTLLLLSFDKKFLKRVKLKPVHSRKENFLDTSMLFQE